MDAKALKKLALIMTVNCVRNTVIEEYHADGKLTDDEMMAFNKEVSNKIYTFLNYMFLKNSEINAEFMVAMSMYYPRDWDQPHLDRDFTSVVKLKRIIK